MSLLLFLLIISLVVSIVIAFFEYDNIRDTIVKFIVSLIFSGIGSFLIAVSFVYDKYQKKEHYLYPISLERKSEIHGDFVLGSGTVEQTEYYYFYYKSIYGYKLSKLPIKNAYLIETDKRKPEIVKVQKCNKTDDYWFYLKSCITERYIFYVPEGTIVRKFEG